MLRQHEVDLLVDVRRFPGSRAQPQWGQEALVAALPVDIGYRWIEALGGRRHTPAGVPTVNDAWRVKAFRDYADHMASAAFRAGLDELLALAAVSRPVIMCSEAVPWRCHRRLITDALLVAGAEVVDILSSTSVRRPALSPSARVEGDRITYPAPSVAPFRN
jgi:uncharacterized protein (DUF488 family)